jgi:hypothetical protein
MKMEDDRSFWGDFDHSPMGYHNPCRRDGKAALFAVCGSDPDRKGGGILFWAYDEIEANRAVLAYRKAGYHNVRFEKNNIID